MCHCLISNISIFVYNILHTHHYCYVWSSTLSSSVLVLLFRNDGKIRM